jgi:hypothetical protein
MVEANADLDREEMRKWLDPLESTVGHEMAVSSLVQMSRAHVDPHCRMA